MKFWKMHGLGNDFIVVDAITQTIEQPSVLAKKLCARRFSVGADGLILLCPSDSADARMRIFNSDGSEPEMCGNGIRCAGKFLYDSGLCRKERLSIETLAGIRIIDLTIDKGTAEAATVDMGKPELVPQKIPVNAESNRISVDLDGRKVLFFCVSMGNPHAVTFDLFPDPEDFQRLGAFMERHPLFPKKANIEFCRAESRESVSVKVWERGDGPTLACGTGSCAVLAAGASMGILDRSADIFLPGGMLHDEWAEDGHIYMTGPAELSYIGETCTEPQ